MIISAWNSPVNDSGSHLHMQIAMGQSTSFTFFILVGDREKKIIFYLLQGI